MTAPTSRPIYVVDDDEAVRESTLLLLEAEGLDATGYSTPREFLDGFDPARAGCLVLDVHMPGMSGIELLSELRARGITTPAIVMTGRADPQLEDSARRHGASLINKPPHDEDLLALIGAALRRPRAT